MQQPTLSQALTRLRSRASSLPTALAVLACLGLTALVDWRIGIVRQSSFEADLHHAAHQLENLPARHQALGAALSLAALSPACREALTGSLPADAPETLAALRQTAEVIKASTAFLVDKRSLIVAYHIDQGKSGTGRNLAHRPYVRSALAGSPNLYAALGGNTLERGIYVAVPVPVDGAIAGAAVLKIGFAEVDVLLQREAGDYALISPEGVVFASNVPTWLFAIDAATDQVTTIAKQDRAAPYYVSERPHLLTEVAPDSRRASTTTVAWQDPAGPWRLIGLPHHRFGLAPLEALLTLLASGALAGAGFLWARQHGHREAERLAAEAAQAHYAAKLELVAAQKSRLTALAAHFQQQDDIAALAAAFLGTVAEQFGVRQGTLYYLPADGNGALTLAGGYGSGRNPAPPGDIRPGDGLVGQCAVDRRPILLTGTPEDYWLIQSGLGQAAPANLLLLPVLRDEQLLGVVELATLAPWLPEPRSQLEELLPILAINLELQISREHTERLLAAATAQAKEPNHAL